MRAEAEAEQRKDETRNIYINNKHNKCENCTKIATTLSRGCPRSQLRRRLERACALCSLSRSPALFAANWDAACDESWRMNQMLNSTDRSVAVAVAVDADVAARIATVANCLPKVFNCFNWQYVIRQFESCQSLGHDFASRQAAAWACSQTGTATPAMAICLSRLAHMATPAANKLSSYRFIALSTVGVGFVALDTLPASSAQLAGYRSIDLSIYRLIEFAF